MGINGKFSNFLFLSILILLFIAIFLQTQKGSIFFKSAFFSFNSFFSNFFHTVKENALSFGENFKSLKKLKREKEELERANLFLKSKIFKLESELQRYRKFVNFLESSEFEFIIAETIGWDITNPYAGIVINKGEKDGVKNYSPVLDKSFNLAGRVLKTHSSSSEVILLTGALFSASVKINEDVFAILSGENSPLCSLNYITDESAVNEGMEVYTSGHDRIFPSGLKVGVISKIVNYNESVKSVSVKPYANFKSIDIVLVLKK